MSEPQNTYTAYINPLYSSAVRRQIGVAIVNFIVNRANNKSGTRGRFKNYSKTYAKHPEFKAAGKSIDQPNVLLHGTMLHDLRVLDIGLSGRVIVGFKSGTKSNDKSVWMREKGYDFMGLSNNELNQVLSGFPLLSSNEIIAQINSTGNTDVN